QVVHFDERTAGENDSALNGVSQFTNISRPGITHNYLTDIGAEPRDCFSILACEKTQQVLRKWQNVSRALTERRHCDFNHIQAVEQIFSEPSRGNFGF